jgi:hypothetical protein
MCMCESLKVKAGADETGFVIDLNHNGIYGVVLGMHHHRVFGSRGAIKICHIFKLFFPPQHSTELRLQC